MTNTFEKADIRFSHTLFSFFFGLSPFDSIKMEKERTADMSTTKSQEISSCAELIYGTDNQYVGTY